LIAFKDGVKWVVLGALFIALPHITGTPQPNAYIGKVPPEMSAHFVSVSMGISMVMWTTLGALLAVFYKK
ncbi:MAG: CbtA family protein, partial [Alphaproteobacteria bacterium]